MLRPQALVVLLFYLFISSLDAVEELEVSSFFDATATVNLTSLQLSQNCAEALQAGGASGVYALSPLSSELPPFYAYCLRDPDGGHGWTVVQRRKDGSTDFYRDWQTYKNGFGNLLREHFIGLDHLHALTVPQLQELWIQMEDFEGKTRFAKYESFAIGSENVDYAMDVLGKFHGNAGDSLAFHAAQKFSTKDRSYGKNYAVTYTGAWWYQEYPLSNLNGQYLRGENKDKFAQGINWWTWHGYYYSLKSVHMAIRPVKFPN